MTEISAKCQLSIIAIMPLMCGIRYFMVPVALR